MPTEGNVFVSVSVAHKELAVIIARQLHEMGYTVMATSGTAKQIQIAGVPVQMIKKIIEGQPKKLLQSEALNLTRVELNFRLCKMRGLSDRDQAPTKAIKFLPRDSYV
ncbi:hypothetical protein N9Y42_04240 [Mariniblastus sp.]|nr:hypothetical protein [Mariniblastus sp.]